MNEKEGEKDDEWERRWERWWMRKKVEEWMKKNNTRANFRRITNLYLLAQFNWSLQSQQNLDGAYCNYTLYSNKDNKYL